MKKAVTPAHITHAARAPEYPALSKESTALIVNAATPNAICAIAISETPCAVTRVTTLLSGDSSGRYAVSVVHATSKQSEPTIESTSTNSHVVGLISAISATSAAFR